MSRILHLNGRSLRPESELAQRECEWITALGLDIHTVVANQDVVINDETLEISVFVLDESGKRKLNYSHPEGGYSRELITIPLIADPANFGLI